MKHFMKRLISVFTVLVLITLITLSSNPVIITQASNSVKTGSPAAGDVQSKEEVIYALLHANGEIQNIYAVNILNVSSPGLVTDYGDYSSVKNLTSTDDIEVKSDQVSVPAETGRFYYQGNIKQQYLPWDIDITYYLDSKVVTANELAGKNGHLKINLQTNPDKEVASVFYQNYLLQISLTLDTTKCSNIIADNATMANAGTNKMITYTVLPSKEGNITVSADVKDFTMESIELSAVPFAMNFDLPDTTELTNSMVLLSDAIEHLNSGMTSLKDGFQKMNTGTEGLSLGSSKFKNGLNQLNAKSAALVKASSTISTALSTISTSLKGVDVNNLSSLSQLPPGLASLSSGLNEISKGLKDLSNGYATAYTALDSAIKAIPDQDIAPEDLQKLSINNPGDITLKQLIDTYTAAKTVKATYQMVSAAFASVGPSLSTMADSITTISTSLNDISLQLTSNLEGVDIASSLQQLTNGITALNNSYSAFHTGLASYTVGVSQLADAYASLDQGINQVADGTNQLNSGIGDLSSGTLELKTRTADMPDQIDTKINELLADYDKSSFTPVSFISLKNTKVRSVQFVMKTEKIEKTEPVITKGNNQNTGNFWTRLRNLFT